MLIGISPVLLLLPPLQINIITPRLRPPPLPFSLLAFIILIGLIRALSKISKITHISTLFIVRVISLIVSWWRATILDSKFCEHKHTCPDISQICCVFLRSAHLAIISRSPACHIRTSGQRLCGTAAQHVTHNTHAFSAYIIFRTIVDFGHDAIRISGVSKLIAWATFPTHGYFELILFQKHFNVE